MSTYYSTGGLNGLLIPWSVLDEAHRLDVASSLSSLSTIPAQPVAAQTTDGVAVATGTWATPPSGGASYDLRIQDAGHVGPKEASWAWKTDTEPVESYRGQDWPTRARRMWMSLARVNETAGRADMVTLPSGRVCIVEGVRFGATPEIRAGYLDGEVLVGGSAGDEIVVATNDSTHAAYEGFNLIDPHGYPSIAYWEEKGLVLIAVRYESGPFGSTTPLGQVAIYQSADEGATYTLRTRAALMEPWLTTGGGGVEHNTYGNLSLRRVGASWVLLSDWLDVAGAYYTEQWSGTSPDRLTLLETALITTGLVGDGLTELAAAGDGDGLVVVGCGYDVDLSAFEDVYAWRLGSAWQPLSETPVTPITRTSSPHAGRYPCIAADRDGSFWAAYLDSTENVVRLTRSVDHGATWDGVGYYPLETAANANITYMALTPYRGGLLLRFVANPDVVVGANWYPTARSRSYLVALGGWDNVPLPRAPASGSPDARLGYGQAAISGGFGVADTDTLSWFPPVDPTTTGPAGVVTGAAPTLTVPDGADPYLSYADAGAGSYVTWTLAAASYDATGIIVECDCSIPVMGASVIANNEIMRIHLRDSGGANSIDVSIRGDATTFELYDHAAGAVKTTVNSAGTTRREYRLAVYKDTTTRCAMYYRTPGEQVWTQYTTTLATIGGLARTVRGGAVTTNGQTIRYYRFEFVGTIGPAGPRDITRTLSVSNLAGRPLSPRPTPMHQGLAVSWQRGPFDPGHTWSLSKTAKYPPALIGARDYPSPSDRWRSSADNVVQDFVWQPAEGQLWYLPGPLTAMLLYADGIESVTLAGRNSAGAYQTLLTATPSNGMASLRYSAAAGGGVTGGSLRPDTTGTTADRPWADNELVGGWVRIATSGAAYRITGSSAGLWGPDASLKPTLTVEGWDTAEPATGGFTVYPPVSLHSSAELSPATGYDRLRLRIAAAANTVEGRYEIKAIIGSIYVPGRRYSYGRTPSVEPLARGVVTAGGRAYYDPNQPLQRVGRFAWQDPIGTRGLGGYTTSAGPDALILASGASHPVSFLASIHRDLNGIMQRLGGPGRTLVYIPRVEPQATTWSTSDPERWLYGRITSALTTPRPWGDESVREEVTVSEITVTEEI